MLYFLSLTLKNATQIISTSEEPVYMSVGETGAPCSFPLLDRGGVQNATLFARSPFVWSFAGYDGKTRMQPDEDPRIFTSMEDAVNL